MTPRVVVAQPSLFLKTLSDFLVGGYLIDDMQAKSDAQLLREYAENGADSAFTAIVARHTNLVYSAALRQTDSPDAAAEVTQSVFIGLARGARTWSPRLAEDASLAGWLCRSARNISLNLRRDEFRQRSRERQAMDNLNSVSETALDWERLRAILDEAMSELSETDYEALVMRFFRNQDLRSIGWAFGVTDDTAQKRVSRALNKLRDILARRGISSTAIALSIVLSANAVQAAPAGLGAAITAATTLAGASTGAAAITTATKTIAMTTLQKATITATLAIVATVGIQKGYKASQLRDQVQMLEQQQKPLAEKIKRLERERDDATQRLASLTDDKRPDTELLKLRDEVTALRQTARERATIESTTVLWANRIALLKQRLDQMPDKRIPEMAFLADKDWAAATRDADLSTDAGARQAMSALRSAAKGNFLNAMRDAIRKYAAAANGGGLPDDPALLAQAINANGALLPSDLAQLKPYFDVPVEDATLARYQFLHRGKVHDNLSDIWVKEIAPPVDAEFDTTHEMGLNSGGVGSVNLIADAVAAAAKDYAHANNGQMPSDPAQLAQYLKQPLEVALVQKYLPKVSADTAVPDK